jgi:hypothetical protein
MRGKQLLVLNGQYECGACHKFKPATDFSFNKNKPIRGVLSWCKNCSSDEYYRNRNAITQKRNQRYHDLRAQVLIHLGNCCKHCGFTDKRALQIDHVHGGGVKESKSMGVMRLLKKVLDDTNGNYQLLCANCNWIKKSENDEYSRGPKKLARYLQ